MFAEGQKDFIPAVLLTQLLLLLRQHSGLFP